MSWQLYTALGIILSCLLIGGVVYFNQKDSIDNNASFESTFIPKVDSPALEWNNITLTDFTQIDSENNICTGSNLGMAVTINPCVAGNINHKDIRQRVVFNWTGNQAKNISWIFVYDGDLIDGTISLYRNMTTYQTDYRVYSQWTNNYLVDYVTSYTDVGTPTGCQIGNSNNTKAYDVTRNANNNITTTRYCFTTINTVNATTFRISGNRDAYQEVQQPISYMGYDDVTDKITYLGKGLLNDDRSYYKVNEVQFNPGQSYDTMWLYTPKDYSGKGKWHILGYETEYGLVNSVRDERYLYIDPWWTDGASWLKKRAITITNTQTAALTNVSILVRINTTLAPTAQSDFGDIRFVNASETANSELFAWNETTDATNSTFWVFFPTLATGNTTIYMYYSNGLVADDFNISRAFEFADHFEGNNVSNDKWLTHAYSAGKIYIANSMATLNGSGSSGYAALLSKRAIAINKTMTAKAKYANSGGVRIMAFAQGGASGPNFCAGNPYNYLGFSALDFRLRTYDGVGNTVASFSNPPPETFNYFTLFRSQTNVTGIYATNLSSYLELEQLTATIFSGTQYVCLSAEDASSELVVDYLYVRPYYDIEPYVSAFGSEESGSAMFSNNPYPINGISFQTNNVTFVGNATSSGESLTNITLYIYNISESLITNPTTIMTGSANETNWNITLPRDGYYNWYVTARGATQNYQSTNKTLYVDLTNPTIIVNPSNYIHTNLTSMPINVGVYDNLNLSSCWYVNFTGVNSTFTCGTNTTVNIPQFATDYNITFWVNDSSNRTAYQQFNFTAVNITGIQRYNPTSYEGDVEYYSIFVNASSNVAVTPRFVYNNTIITGYNVSSNIYNTTYTIPPQTVLNISNMFWWNWSMAFNNGTQQNFTSRAVNQTQNTLGIVLTQCTATVNKTYLNITFKNETTLQEPVMASIVSSFIYYWTVPETNKTLSFTNVPENSSYAFCFSKPDETLNVYPSITYDNTYSVQRNYIPGWVNYTNVTTNLTLYLLPDDLATSVTFIVYTSARQPISGAIISVYNGAGLLVESKTTGDSGSATFSLNPYNTYTLTVVKTGYTTYTATDAYTTSPYTIIMGGSESITDTGDCSRGIKINILPNTRYLTNGTWYNVSATLYSSYYDIANWGIKLYNANNTLLATNSTNVKDTTLTLPFFTGTNSSFRVKYFYLIQNATATICDNDPDIIFKVDSTGSTEWSITHALTDFRNYILPDSGTGIFGLTAFGLNIIVFFVIFGITGIFAYKFGMTNPLAVISVMFVLVFILDVGFNFITYPEGLPLDHWASIVVGIVLGVLVIKEAASY